MPHPTDPSTSTGGEGPTSTPERSSEGFLGRGSRWFRAGILRLGLSAFGLVVALAVLEVGARVFHAFRDPSHAGLHLTYGRFPKAIFGRILEHYTVHPRGYYAFPADTVYENLSWSPLPLHINNLGLRGTTALEVSAAPVDRLRVVTLGGSSTWGAGVNDGETYPARLQGLLETEIGRGAVEVINGGLPWFSAPDIEVLVERLIVGLEPDLVTFYLGHNDASRGVTSLIAQRELPGTLSNLYGVLNRVSGKSYLFKKIQFRLHALGNPQDGQLSRPFGTEDLERFFPALTAVFRERLEALKEALDRRGVAVLFITQVESPAYQYLERGDTVVAQRLDAMTYQSYEAYLEEALATVGLDELEVYYLAHQRLTDVVRTVANDDLVDFALLSGGSFDILQNYIHLTSEGNALLAGFIASVILDLCADGHLEPCAGRVATDSLGGPE